MCITLHIHNVSRGNKEILLIIMLKESHRILPLSQFFAKFSVSLKKVGLPFQVEFVASVRQRLSLMQMEKLSGRFFGLKTNENGAGEPPLTFVLVLGSVVAINPLSHRLSVFKHGKEVGQLFVFSLQVVEALDEQRSAHFFRNKLVVVLDALVQKLPLKLGRQLAAFERQSLGLFGQP